MGLGPGAGGRKGKKRADGGQTWKAELMVLAYILLELCRTRVPPHRGLPGVWGWREGHGLYGALPAPLKSLQGGRGPQRPWDLPFPASAPRLPPALPLHHPGPQSPQCPASSPSCRPEWWLWGCQALLCISPIPSPLCSAGGPCPAGLVGRQAGAGRSPCWEFEPLWAAGAV